MCLNGCSIQSDSLNVQYNRSISGLRDAEGSGMGGSDARVRCERTARGRWVATAKLSERRVGGSACNGVAYRVI